MSKLEDMLTLSRKLAAQAPRKGDRFLWSEDNYAEDVAQFLYRGNSEPGLAIDPPASLLQAIEKDASHCHVVWSGTEPAHPTASPDKISSSHRHPTNLTLTDNLVQTALVGVETLRDLQDLVTKQSSNDAKAWIAAGSCSWIAATFTLNGLSQQDRTCALAEFKRVLSPNGVFRTVVLAADEPGSELPLDYAGQTFNHIPLETDLAPNLAEAGFHGITLTPLSADPILTSGGAELRLFGLEAFLGTAGICLEQGDAAVYLGPWKSVEDDDGHTYPRGVRVAVCAKTANVLSRRPYEGAFLIIKAYQAPPLSEAGLFDCSRDVVRPPGETKGRFSLGQLSLINAQSGNQDCGPDCAC